MASFWRFLLSELRLMLGRRRNQVGLLALAVVPVLMAIAVHLADDGPSEGGGPTFIGQITQNGLFVAFAALGVELTLFLPTAVALVAGDAIAGEAHGGTLRYLLTVPAGRTRLLAVKYVGLVLGALLATLVVAVTGVVVGVAFFGAGSLTTFSGSQIGLGEGLWRLLLCVLYVTSGLAALAAVGLFVSTLTEQPIAATVGIIVLVTTMWIVDTIPQLSVVHPWLLVDRWPAFADVMRDPPVWDTLLPGLLVNGVYALVALLLAWARFGGKDITS